MSAKKIEKSKFVHLSAKTCLFLKFMLLSYLQGGVMDDRHTCTKK